MALIETGLDLAQQNSPVNLYNTTAPGSDYANTFSGVSETLLLRPAIDPKIIQSFPKQFTDVQFMMSLPQRGTPNMEFFWAEQPYLIKPVALRTGVSAPGVDTNQSVPITDATYNFVGLNDKLLYPNGQNGTVVAKSGSPGSYVATVRPNEGEGLPALAATDILGNRGPATADGVSSIPYVYDPEVIKFSNIIEKVGPVAIRFDEWQLKEWERSGTTDFIQVKMRAAYERFLIGLHQTLWMSQYGRTTLADGVSKATYTRGILQQQADAGVAIQPVTTATFIDVLRQTIFDTALTGESERVIFATRRWLNLIGTNQKADKVRFTSGDQSWDMDVYSYEFFGHKVTLVPMDQWEDRGSYGTTMVNDIVMLNKSDLEIRYFDGFPMISQKYELLNRENGNPGNLYNFRLVYWTGQMGVQLKRAWATARFRMAA